MIESAKGQEGGLGHKGQVRPHLLSSLGLFWMLVGKQGRSQAMPGHHLGRCSPATGEARGTQRFAASAGAGEQGSPPARISFTSHSVFGIVAGAPAWVQLRAGDPKK